jgi:hypothetical protein
VAEEVEEEKGKREAAERRDKGSRWLSVVGR